MIVMFSILIPFDRKVYSTEKMDIKLILQKQKCIFAGMYLILSRPVLQCMHAYVCKH